MKKLILMRHAEAAWHEGKDIDRTLTQQGRQDAQYMGELLVKMGVGIDAILCSAARRTRETLSLFLEEYPFSGAPLHLNEFYRAQLRDYVNALGKLPAEVKTAMIIGHNPTISAAFEYFTQTHQPFYPATVVYLEFDCQDWKYLLEKPDAKLLGYWAP